MKTILVTGANGFVGRNFCATLAQQADVTLLRYDLQDNPSHFSEAVLAANAIVHLAGVNRPERPEEFRTGNVDLTRKLTKLLREAGRVTPVIMSSSAQAALDNPYGQSKREAEEEIFDYGQATGAPVFIYRLPNLFGKWCRANYNSVVATFCHNMSHGLPIQVNDPSSPLSLVYIDDLVESFLEALDGRAVMDGNYCVVRVVHHTTVGDLADQIRAFPLCRTTLAVPDMANALTRKLYSTYLSSLPIDEFSYPLTTHSDNRGSFTEFLKTSERGQISVNISRPGITKGNHWHHSKHEKFLVVSGHGIIRFRQMGSEQVLEYPVSAEKLQVVEIPPGYTHNITNLGNADMVTIMWVNEPFNREHPDTMQETV